MISAAILAQSIRYVESLDLCGKERLSDDIFIKQPNLLSVVLCLSRLDVPMDKLGEVLHILFVLYDAFHNRSGLKIPKVSQRMIDKANANTTAMLQYLDKEGAYEGNRLIGKAMLNSPNKFVTAFVLGYMNEHGFDTFSQANEYCIRAAKVVMDCFIEAGESVKNGKPAKRR
ncbi:MAG: hypothetical protein A2487_18275 [Candidatus Raymondbacteria bacterium RifOxyC12_full_50_8]|uniref:Uncharacterized protein n=1 Tax=Candidatus Raymondbacteria bacterium RIFOXYD12_FULL_49_13 TaxID=1817890 RepID=A0A1F7F5N6_UNCRA|nr:MAG: hypothetical protein A2350_08315 [Candidatus Raymondbacteria bacterium RifOxyB12_full_50_8]OGJ87171.1 MAG: hypothetical protein A2248_04010 [Candidatus Raymondbacteria bacterium RIFOXYA2_FULL_49_16]OGJ95348.1 MAG: hypothetical protein A2487_18275 [Candidatus Raymondbacteria bacterium RifOxyC12_full_50_8]OGK01826.1 MAG: hypothetical protein A2519_03115 [Candidatus Raymondbacteria bacterium RIFOXYD12_FULL_49_13]OGP41167.1 MAG: hypothetical protein A2324_08655 [Candidatus Raymondbacteria b